MSVNISTDFYNQMLLTHKQWCDSLYRANFFPRRKGR